MKTLKNPSPAMLLFIPILAVSQKNTTAATRHDKELLTVVGRELFS